MLPKYTLQYSFLLTLRQNLLNTAMNLQRLTILVEILDAGNLSKAARKLKMTRANISYHLNLLEKEVGAQLVRRSTLSVEQIGRAACREGGMHAVRAGRGK